MNKLLQIREKINKAKRLNQTRFLATKNGESTPYKILVIQERIRQVQKGMELQYS